MSQTSYAINLQPFSYEGQVADSGNATDTLSPVAVAGAIPYGKLVVVDSANSGGFDQLAGKLPSSSGDIAPGKIIGISLADQARAQNPSVTLPTYLQGSAVPCRRIGRVVVLSESAVADGAPVYARFASGDGGALLGAFSGVLDTSVVGNKLVPNAVWRGAYAAPGFAVVEMLAV